MLIGADWRAGGGAALDVENPASGEVIGSIATAAPADIDAAVQAARHAFDDKRWRGMAPAARAAILWRVSELLAEHADELATLETLENGKPLIPMRAHEVPFAAECFRYHAGWCTKLAGAAQPLAGATEAEFMAYTRREPVGVCALIVPWNGPLVQASWKLAPALAAGCSVVLKPAELTPLVTLRLAELLLEAGLPPGVVNVINGTGAEVGAALARHPDVNKVSFTGSTAVGRELAASVGADLKRLTLELGGKSPCIVFADADLDKAIPGVAAAIFSNAGQVCVAGSRLYVERAVYGEVLSG
ncbi:MAG: aldehyde dehydrogenase family protein, partial [Gammaproteobacteria bacterium]|nr:aldehyde dehydrogenase family protein [Gammaproteobacteria bacterium]